MTLHNLEGNIAFCEAQGLAKVFQAYADECAGEDIQEVGFNHYSGYVYIALGNGIQICSAFGRDVEFLTTNFYSGEETFHDTYEEACQIDEVNDQNIDED